jgi:3-phosphoshikimate 1-carboxyvinyltransferase
VRDGRRVSVRGGQVPVARDLRVPGDVSSAAFWAVAAAAQPGSELALPGVGLNPTRTGVLDVLRRMGAAVHLSPDPENRGAGEPSGTVTVAGSALRGTTIGGDEIPNVIDELPVLAVAGALAAGTTLIRDAAELRVKESDRIRCVAENLRAMGASVREFDDGMEIEGGHPLRGAAIDSHGDHRIAMAFAVAGLFAAGETRIDDVACIATSYPGFDTDLDRAAHGGLRRPAA